MRKSPLRKATMPVNKQRWKLFKSLFFLMRTDLLLQVWEAAESKSECSELCTNDESCTKFFHEETFKACIMIKSDGDPLEWEDKTPPYDCQEDRKVYLHRKFPDKPKGYKQGKTETWQECQKQCAEIKTCKFFSWHNHKNRYAKSCSLMSKYTGKISYGTVVSGPRECPKK